MWPERAPGPVSWRPVDTGVRTLLVDVCSQESLPTEPLGTGAVGVETRLTQRALGQDPQRQKPERNRVLEVFCHWSQKYLLGHGGKTFEDGYMWGSRPRNVRSKRSAMLPEES